MSAARFVLTTVLAGQLALTFGPVFAAGADKDPNNTVNLIEKDATNPSLFAFNYGPTQTPALNLLGVSPTKATLYTGTQPFAFAIPSVLDGSGQQSIGLDLSPAWALKGYWPIRKDDYQDDFGKRLWYRLRLELATTDGATSTTSASKIQPSGIAFGVSTAFLGSSDPVTARVKPDRGYFFDSCLRDRPSTGVPSLLERITATDTQLIPQLQQAEGETSFLAASLQALRHVKSAEPKDWPARVRNNLDALIRTYQATPFAKDGPPPPFVAAAKPPTPPEPRVVLLEFRDIFQAAAASAPTDAAKQRVLDAAEELSDHAEGWGNPQ